MKQFRLQESKHYYDALDAARNPHSTHGELMDLVQHRSGHVVDQALKNPNATDEHFEKAMKHPNFEVSSRARDAFRDRLESKGKIKKGVAGIDYPHSDKPNPYNF